MTVIVLNKAPKRSRGVIVASGVKPPKSVEWEARRAILNGLREFDEEMADFAERVEDYPPSLISQYLKDLQEKWFKKIDPIADKISENWLASINRRQKKKSMEILRKALGVDISTIFEDPLIEEGLRNMRYEAAYLIKTIPYDCLGKVAERIFQHYQGQAMPEGRTLTQQIKEEFKIKNERAKVIARDQTNKMNGNLNQIRQTTYGIEEYIWRTSRDNRVVGNPAGFYPRGNKMHGNHYEREGKMYKWNEPPEDGHPGYAIQCITGETPVILPGTVKRLFRRRYKGVLYKLTLGSGELNITPNHPLLTARGWMPAYSLQAGDKLVRAVGKDGQPASEIWNKLKKTPEKRQGRKNDFHKDGCVDVVYIKQTGETTPQSKKKGLIGRIISIFKKQPLLEDILGALTIEDIKEYMKNKDLNGFTYSFDEIKSITSGNFDGFVYNFETEKGCYVAGGYVNHNCRCYADPVIDLNKLKVQYY